MLLREEKVEMIRVTSNAEGWDSLLSNKAVQVLLEEEGFVKRLEGGEGLRPVTFAEEHCVLAQRELGEGGALVTDTAPRQGSCPPLFPGPGGSDCDLFPGLVMPVVPRGNWEEAGLTNVCRSCLHSSDFCKIRMGGAV